MATNTDTTSLRSALRKHLDFAIAGTKHALTGSRQYYAWLGALGVILLVGLVTFVAKYDHGLIITSSRHLNPWGTIIYSQFPFFVGVAAGGVMITVPAHMYHREDFESIVTFGEALAVAAVLVSMGCVLVMLGNLNRLVYIMPITGTPNFPQSMLPWDVIALNGYLVLNLIIAGYGLYKLYHAEKPHPWRRYLVYFAVPWGISIHAVTAFIIIANPIRHLWYTALMIPRFLTSAFVAGPALMILILLAIRRTTGGSIPGLTIEDDTLLMMGHMVLYALLANFFSVISEIVTLGLPNTGHWATMKYLLFGLEKHGHVYNMLTPLMWVAIIAEVVAIVLLIHPRTRRNLKAVAVAAGAAFTAVFIEKGIILFVSVFIISPLGQFYEPKFTVPEFVLAISLWALGALVFTILAKAAIGFRVNNPPEFDV